jgi:glycosyltransferase involved in cell wall biosynthesis
MSISVAICTHNGADRIAATLAGLQLQEGVSSLQWEVLLIDNACSDDTCAVAADLWHCAVPFRIIREERLGLSHARERAFAEAAHELVAFLDDDNEPDPGWLASAARVMEAHPETGACGGRVQGIFREPPPHWFRAYEEDFCVGDQASADGDVTDSRGYLWGAGLVVRKSAWRSAVAAGFRHRLPDRRGNRLSGGGDVELCLAIRAAGWRLRYDRGMVVLHHIPHERITVANLRRLRRGHGAASVALDAYGFPFDAFARCRARHGRVRRALSAIRGILRHLPGTLHFWQGDVPDLRVLELEYLFGRLRVLGSPWPTPSPLRKAREAY